MKWMIVILSTLTIGFSAADAAVLLVANKSANTVDLVDPTTGKSAATLETGYRPHEIAVRPDGAVAVISNYGDGKKAGSSLTVIDVPGKAVLRTISLGDHTRPHGLAWLDGNRVAVTTEGSAHLVVVDVEAAKVVSAVETAQRVSHMVAVSRDGSRGFVANIGSGNVTAIDLTDGKKLGDIETGAGAEGIATSPDGSEIWVGNREADTLSIIDPMTLKVVGEVSCPGFPIRVAFTPDGKRALVSAAKTGEVVVFDVNSRKELVRRKLDLSTVDGAAERLFGTRFGESPVPVGLVISPDGKRAFVAATQADVVVVVDPSSLDVIDLIKAGEEPDGMAWAK
jgi:YVTN family beta-propeller protein